MARETEREFRQEERALAPTLRKLERTEEERKRAIDAGIDGYISKPIRVASFDKLVLMLLRQARANLEV